MLIRCAACLTEIKLPERVGFRDTCPSCDAWLHSCVNCRFWERDQCIEPSAEKVKDPEGQNFCEWLVARTQHAAPSTQESNAESGKEAAEEMWKRLTKK